MCPRSRSSKKSPKSTWVELTLAKLAHYAAISNLWPLISDFSSNSLRCCCLTKRYSVWQTNSVDSEITHYSVLSMVNRSQMQYFLQYIPFTGLLLVLCNREYKIEVRDSSFQPQIIVIEEGDRIWWEWTKDKVTMMMKRRPDFLSKYFSILMHFNVCCAFCDFVT